MILAPIMHIIAQALRGRSVVFIPPPAVSSVSSATQIEGTSLVHTVTLASAVTGTPGYYFFSIGGGTASTPSDYNATPTFSNGVTLSGGMLTVPVAVSSFTITVATSQDTIFEGAETYTVTVGSLSNTGTINDDDAAPTVTSVSSASATEGSSIVHTVAITGTAQAARTFALTLSGGTATGGGTDYTSTLTNGAFSAGVTISAGNISVPPGVTGFTVSVPTTSDALTEGDETYTLTIGGASGTGTILDSVALADFYLNLSNPVNCTIADSQGAGTLVPQADFYLNLSNPVNCTISDAQAVGTITGGSLITPSVTISRTSGAAPLAVHFDATATTAASYTSRPFHEMEYRWDFGDETVSTWTYGAQPGVLLKNVAFGPVAAHVYETAGTYTPSLQVRFRLADGTYDTTVQTQSSIVVAAADTEWAGTKTYTYSTNTDHTGAPAGSIPVDNVTDIAAAIEANLGSGNRRHLLRAGQTFAAPTNFLVNVGGGANMVGKFGAGAKPIWNRTANVVMVNLSSPSTPTGVSNWRFVDIVFEGNSTGSSAISGEGSCSNFLFLRCDVQNIHYGYTFSGSVLNLLNADVNYTHEIWDEIYIVDNSIFNLTVGNGPCGIFGGLNRLVVLGTEIDNNLGGEHGCRTQYSNRNVFSNNTVLGIAAGKANFSIRGGLFGGDATMVAGQYSEKNIVSDNDFVGGESLGIFGIGPQNGVSDERGRNMIVERNIFRGSASTINVMTCAQPDISFRNNVALLSAGTFLAMERPGMTPVPTNVNVHHNTVYASGTGGVSLVTFAIQVGSGDGQSPIGTCTVIARNNLAYAPSSAGYSSMFSNPELVGSVTESNNSSDFQLRNTAPNFTVQPPTTIAHCKPTSGYAVGGGVKVNAIYRDILGVAIPVTPDIGALVA